MIWFIVLVGLCAAAIHVLQGVVLLLQFAYLLVCAIVGAFMPKRRSVLGRTR